MKIAKRFTLLSACLISSSLMAQSPRDAKTPLGTTIWTGSIQAEVGYWLGDATYSIGGQAWSPETGKIQLPDKISELKFPLDVAYGALGGNLFWKNKVEIFGSLSENLTDPSSKMKDSDWGVFDDSGSLDIYSESDAKLTAVAADVGVRYWFSSTTTTNRSFLLFGIGPSLTYQHLDWTLSNVDQWYPSQPRMAHDTQSGVGATYNADIIMPYLNACALFKFKRISGRLEIGLGPALVQDEDNHVIRQKRSTADMVGVGAKGAVELRYDLSRNIFTLARVSALSVQATGTSTDTGYGGELQGYNAEIDEDFALTSFTGGLAVGYNF